MPITLLPSRPHPLSKDGPSGPQGLGRRRTQAEDPGRVAAFVFELDALFDVERYDRARARAVARRLAVARGLNPLWSEVMAIELTRAEGATAAIETLGRLTGHPVDPAVVPVTLAGLRLREGADRMLLGLRQRFKLGLLATRPGAEAQRILAALELERLFDVLVLPGAAASAAAQADPCAGTVGRLQERADSCVLVGPQGSALLGDARRLGMRTVAIGPARPQADPPGADLCLPGLHLIEALAAGASSKYGEGTAPRPSFPIPRAS